MNTSLGLKLSAREEEIVILLYRYRGMTAHQLAQKVHGSLKPISSKKSMIYNYLKRLELKHLVKSSKFRNQTGYSSLYYLTPFGFLKGKDLLKINFAQVGVGYRHTDQPSDADLDYAIYKPPLTQTAHHLLLIDALLRIDYISTDALIDYRLSTYATKIYDYKGTSLKLRPDGEIIFPDRRKYCLEIDKGTEGYQQLYDKFVNYKNYIAQLEISDYPTGILFITDEKKQSYGLKRRWTTVLTAFLNAMGEYAELVKIVLTPLNHLQENILFELNRFKHIKKSKQLLISHFSEKGYPQMKFWTYIKDQPDVIGIAIKGKSYQLVFTAAVNEFDSSSFGQYFRFLKLTHNMPAFNELDGLTRLGHEQVLFSVENKIYLPSHFPTDKWNGDKQSKTELLHDYLTLLPL